MTWSQPFHLDLVASPGLLVDSDKVKANIEMMIAMVDGSVNRLRPHVKTHKMPAVIQLQIRAGITKFKAATLAEAEMVASAGGSDVLLAYQMVGPNVERFLDLVRRFPNTSFAAIVDDRGVAQALGQAFNDDPLRLFIDVDCGMHRTGIPLGDELEQLRTVIEDSSALEYAGLHVYDGHLHQPESATRIAAAKQIINAIRQYDSVHPSRTLVGGGSPTFPVWATETTWECSPGTPVFWDAGYGDTYPELSFQKAMALVTRVISKPGNNGRKLLCLDLGYKSIASEMPLEKRVQIPAIPDAKFVGQSEEHLVIETTLVDDIQIGQPFLAIPRHVCPTVALHAFATVVRDNSVTDERWFATARDRVITH
jgi:D-serine deaminase-like pyridoxal phosphate-dependent protein